MNRRTVLRSAGVVAVASLAGCVDAVEDHFTGSLQSPVPIEITNEGDRPYNISLDAVARDGGRETYEESYTITPDERVAPPHIEGEDQQFRITRHGDDEIEDLVEMGEITDETNLVLISLYEDEIELEIIEDEDEAEETEAEVEEEYDEADNAAQG
ncbi:hypothetical protein [Natronococcus occultus]|uniref:Uncharacterized protein n=1 Tax=Natronococcus occultus SP4 TaxID=694430 RepID=L0K477_9EURY|nr:hypothetical protein [Natronococcus occultus]AGB39340.1 hypothetical protein Natoc_3623 [Natronococcus occultus SP4]